VEALDIFVDIYVTIHIDILVPALSVSLNERRSRLRLQAIGLQGHWFEFTKVSCTRILSVCCFRLVLQLE
jgi:hypothetical protein